MAERFRPARLAHRRGAEQLKLSCGLSADFPPRVPTLTTFAVRGRLMMVDIVGTGHVGLVSGVCLVEFGYRVFCVETSPKMIAGLQVGKVPI